MRNPISYSVRKCTTCGYVYKIGSGCKLCASLGAARRYVADKPKYNKASAAYKEKVLAKTPAEYSPETFKTCTTCKIPKVIGEYYPALLGRYSVESICKLCSADYAKVYAANNKHELISKRLRDKDKRSVYKAKYYAKNRDMLIEKSRGVYASLSKEDKHNRRARCSKGMPSKVKATKRKYKIKRKNSMSKAFVSWADDFILAEIDDLCTLRTISTGFSWHVDHIVPLISNYVSGLHWEGNLSVIPASVNISKGNHHWPDMPIYTTQDKHELKYYKWLSEMANQVDKPQTL
jgi:hypothetical protein